MRTPVYGDLQLDDPFFSPEDHAVFEPEKASSPVYDGARQGVRDKFLALHDILYPEIEGQTVAAMDQVDARLTMFDLLQRHGRQRKRSCRRSTTSAAPQQRSLFGSGQVTSA